MRSIIKCPYYYFDGVIPDAMCDTIVELGKTKEQMIAGINVENTTDNKMRKGEVAWIKDDWVQQMLETYASKANIEAGWHFVVDSKEHIQFATYEDSAFYDYHRDCNILQAQYRKLSISVQLSSPDDYDGGDLLMKHFWGTTNLPMDKEIKNKGTIIVFPSILLHKVTPVTEGTRHSLVQWFSGPDFV